MTCFKPLKAWKPLSPVNGGAYVFDATKALNPDSPTILPCGQCRGCRSDKSSDWAIRCSHEAQLRGLDNSFVTLTFKDEHLPANGSISVRDIQLFIKRLRKRFGAGVRYFAVGEYGDKTGRPHYHLLLFGLWFSDAKFYRTNDRGDRLFTSEILSELWPYGLHEIGTVTAASAGYCAQYVQKKLTGPLAVEHYVRPHPVTGHLHRVAPEFAVMSRRPGIGFDWFTRYAGDVFPSDHVIVDGRPRKVPRYYVDLLSEPEIERVKRARRRLGNRYSFQHSGEAFRSAEKAKADRTPERLAVRQFIHEDRLKRLVRSL